MQALGDGETQENLRQYYRRDAEGAEEKTYYLSGEGDK